MDRRVGTAQLRTLRIPAEDFNKIHEAKKMLIMKGVENLDRDLRGQIQKQSSDFEKFTIGLIVGIGATLLIQELTKED